MLVALSFHRTVPLNKHHLPLVAEAFEGEGGQRQLVLSTGDD
jgi:hypothetical protein